MCDPFTIAAIATGVGSTAAGAVGSSKNKKANAYAQNQQTEMSKEQFDSRTKLANEIFAENLGLSASVFDELASLSDQEFQQRNGLSKKTFQDLLATEDAQMLRDSGAASANTNTIRDARLGRDALRDAARTERDTARDTAARRYSEILAGANQRQDGFRAEGDSIASDLVAAFTPGAFEGRRADATAARDALVATAASPSSPTASLPMSGAGKAAYSRYAGKGLADAAAENTAKSRVASYGDAVESGGRTIDRGNERTAFVTDAARRALAPLGAELGTQTLAYNNAAGAYGDKTTAYADTYADRVRAADADLNAALGLSATEAQGKGRAISRYGTDMDAALAAFFGGKIGSTGSRGDALIGANDTRLAGTNSASMNLENGMQGITQFRMANNGPGIWGTLSQFGSSLTPTLFQAGAQGSGFKKPAQTAA